MLFKVKLSLETFFKGEVEVAISFLPLLVLLRTITESGNFSSPPKLTAMESMVQTCTKMV